MKQFYLAEIVTKDKLIHQGLFFRPKKAGKKAILWVHGLTDNFYGDKDILEELAQRGEEDGVAVASFNTRGHDIVSSVKKIDESSRKGQTSVTLGSAHEVFTESTWDIGAGISFLSEQGFSKIMLAGISTGANKVCYFAALRKEPRVVGIALISPMSDVPIVRASLGERYETLLQSARTSAHGSSTNAYLDVYDGMPATPKRFISLAKPGSVEDVFPYYDPKRKPVSLASVRKPLLVVLGERDEYADRPIGEIAAWFDKHKTARSFKTTIIPGGLHGLGGKEKEVASTILRWASQI